MVTTKPAFTNIITIVADCSSVGDSDGAHSGSMPVVACAYATIGHPPSGGLPIGTVFVPMGKPPEGGWPIVAYAHATTGIEPECAPSLSPTLLQSATIVMMLVKAGFVVTMPDYQGLGLDK